MSDHPSFARGENLRLIANSKPPLIALHHRRALECRAGKTGSGDTENVARHLRGFNLLIGTSATFVPRALRPITELLVFGDAYHPYDLAEHVESVKGLFSGRVERVVLLTQYACLRVAYNEVKNDKCDEGESLTATHRPCKKTRAHAGVSQNAKVYKKCPQR